MFGQSIIYRYLCVQNKDAEMKKTITILSQGLLIAYFLFFSFSVLAKAEEQREYASRKYKLVFQDEFNQRNGSLPDSTKWRFRERANNICARWNSRSGKVAFIKNGKLCCRAIPNVSEQSDTAKMLTGSIDTKGRFSIRYGKIEVRLRTRVKEGNFPAAWMRPVDDGHPYTYAEFDIFETFGKDGLARQTVHSHRSEVLKKDCPKHSFSTKVDLSKWHVYAVEWDRDQVVFSIDGVITGKYPRLAHQDGEDEGQWSFDRNFFIILDQSVGKKGWHEPDTHAVYETQFDWVRVYKRIR